MLRHWVIGLVQDLIATTLREGTRVKTPVGNGVVKQAFVTVYLDEGHTKPATHSNDRTATVGITKIKVL